MKEENGGERGVQPLNMVDRSTALSKPHFRSVFVSRQSGQALFSRRWLTALPIPKQERYHNLVSLGLFAEPLSPEGSSQKDTQHLDVEFPVTGSKEGQRW